MAEHSFYMLDIKCVMRNADEWTDGFVHLTVQSLNTFFFPQGDLK